MTPRRPLSKHSQAPPRRYGDAPEERAAIDEWVVRQLSTFPEPSEWTKQRLRQILARSAASSLPKRPKSQDR